MFSFFSNPANWDFSPTGQRLKPTGEPLMKVIYGSATSARGDTYPAWMLMRKSVYDLLTKGELHLVHTGKDTGYVHPDYRSNAFVLADADGTIVPPINDEIY